MREFRSEERRELHDHEAIASRQHAQVQDFQDVVVADATRGLRFALEALHDIRVHRGFAEKHLDRHPPADRDVLALVYFPHTALPDQAHDAVLV